MARLPKCWHNRREPLCPAPAVFLRHSQGGAGLGHSQSVDPDLLTPSSSLLKASLLLSQPQRSSGYSNEGLSSSTVTQQGRTTSDHSHIIPECQQQDSGSHSSCPSCSSSHCADHFASCLTTMTEECRGINAGLVGRQRVGRQVQGGQAPQQHVAKVTHQHVSMVPWIWPPPHAVIGVRGQR